MPAELIILVLLIIVNGIFAMSELAVMSARKARLGQLADGGDMGARAALELANNPNRFLSTVQIGITLIGILAGAFGGATIARELAGLFRQIPALMPHSEALGFGIVVTLTTYLSLVIGELVPKRLALQNPERVASLVARPMRLLSVAGGPLVQLLSRSTELALRLMGAKPSDEPPVTEDEIRVLMEAGTEAGVFNTTEQEMVAGVFRLDDLRADALMTHRTEIVAIDLDHPRETIYQTLIDCRYSRLPVYRKSLDHVTGIVLAKDLLKQTLSGQPCDPAAVMKTPVFVPESAPASLVLKRFKETGRYMALVMDEYGGIQGLLTMTDVLEAVVGTLDEPQSARRGDGSWLLDGMMPIDEFKDLFDIEELVEEDEANYQTLAGFIMLHEGRIPSAGDHFEWGGLYFEVVDMDGKRIDKVLVKQAGALSITRGDAPNAARA